MSKTQDMRHLPGLETPEKREQFLAAMQPRKDDRQGALGAVVAMLAGEIKVARPLDKVSADARIPE